MDVRRTGIWMVAVGALALATGLVTDAVQHADDPSLADREGIFDLASFPHALFFGGLCVAVLGVLALLVGQQLYAPGRPTVWRRLGQVLTPIAAVVLIGATAAAASNSSLGEPGDEPAPASEGDDAQPAGDGGAHDHGDGATTDDHGDGATTDDHGDHGDDTSAGLEPGDVIEGTATGDSPCEIASPVPASPGQVGTGEGGSQEVIGEHGHRGMVVQAPLTAEERELLQQQIAQARTVVDQYPTVAAAEAGGYHMSTFYVPCIGAHYTNVQYIPQFDPTKPSELLFDGTTPDAKLVGLSYLVYNRGGPPEGFAGANDHWHQHNANGGLCFGDDNVVIGGESMTEEECAEIGGDKRLLVDIWMMHAWVVPGFECSWGVFAGECPELGGRVGGTAWDEPTPDDDDFAA